MRIALPSLVVSIVSFAVACSAGGGADVVQDGAGGQGGTAENGGGFGGEQGQAGSELGPPEEETPPENGGSAGQSAGGGSGGAPGKGGSSGTTAGGTGGGASGGAGFAGDPCVSDDGWPQASTTFECEVVKLVNERRAEGATCGLVTMPPAPPMTMHPLLRQVARAHAKDMADKGYFDHASPDGSSSGDRMKAAGYEGTYYGENIAQGQDDPAAVMKSWMGSSGHCKGLMASKYVHIGMGYAATADGDTYWVQDFAAP